MSKTPDKSAPLTGAIPYNNLNNPQTVEENPYSDDITVVVNNKPVAITRGSHHHDSYEFVITYSEIPYMIIDNKIYNVPKNSLFAVNPMQEHGLGKDLNNFRLCGIHISKEFMQNVAANIYNRSDIFFSNDPFIVGHDLNMLIRLFLEEMKYLRTGRELMINNLGTMLAVTFIRNINSNLTSIPHNPPRLRKDSIRKIIDYMNENYSRNISCSELSSLIKTNKFTLIRAFKIETGKTPYEYLLDLKLEKAKKMLEDNIYSITEISLMCGFSSHSHFTSTFKRKTGQSPTSYKANLNL